MEDEVIILGDPSGDTRGREIFWPLIVSSRSKVGCWNVQGLKPWKVNDNDFLNHLKGNDIVFLIDNYAEPLLTVPCDFRRLKL